MAGGEEIDSEILKTLLKGRIGVSITYLASAGSTNTVAWELAEKGAPHGTVVVADCQTKGRGRLGREWISPAGHNIYMSVILRPSMRLRDATLLTIVAAVAVAGALRDDTGVHLSIKWPNDLMVSDKKIGGILCEVKSVNGEMAFGIIGIGVNVNSAVSALPPQIRGTATSLRGETKKEHSRTDLIAAILNRLDNWIHIMDASGRGPLLNEWRRLSSTLKMPVKVVVGTETVSGFAEDIDDEGMLLLRMPSGIVRRISSGDVSMLR